MTNLDNAWHLLINGWSMLTMCLAYAMLFKVVIDSFFKENTFSRTKKQKPKIKEITYFQQTIFNSQVARWGCAFIVDCFAKALLKTAIENYINNIFGSNWYNEPNNCFMSVENHEAILGQAPLEAEEEIIFEGGIKDKFKVADFMLNWADGVYRLSVDMGGSNRHYWGLKKKDLEFTFMNPDKSITKKEFIGYRRLI